MRWTLTAVVAILTELVCVFIIACTAQLQNFKFNSVLSILSHVSNGFNPLDSISHLSYIYVDPSLVLVTTHPLLSYTQRHWYLTFGAFILFMFFCLIFAAISCIMCLIEPACAGSGKCVSCLYTLS